MLIIVKCMKKIQTSNNRSVLSIESVLKRITVPFFIISVSLLANCREKSNSASKPEDKVKSETGGPTDNAKNAVGKSFLCIDGMGEPIKFAFKENKLTLKSDRTNGKEYDVEYRQNIISVKNFYGKDKDSLFYYFEKVRPDGEKISPNNIFLSFVPNEATPSDFVCSPYLNDDDFNKKLESHEKSMKEMQEGPGSANSKK